jgi:uncharacterized protein (TIGR02118 family)
MRKIVFCCRRKSDVPAEEFHRYWLEHHGELVKSLREVLPGMTRYAQSHTLPGPETDRLRAGRGTDEPFDGVAEIWLDTTVKAEDAAAARAAMAQLVEDEMRFLDLPRSVIFMTEEHVIFD